MLLMHATLPFMSAYVALPLPGNIPIRLWIFTMKHDQGHLGYEIVVWNRTRFVSIEMQ